MSDSTKAVFLSYASQDAEAAARIAEALRAAGIVVWFDKDELAGGDAWDAKLRQQIAECALFVPIISANTQARGEGYFRIEWRLAAQRTHAMAEDQAFLLPVVIDETRDAEARVPGEFKSVQWTRLLPAGSGGLARGDAIGAFCERVKALLGGKLGARASTPAAATPSGGTPALPGKTATRPWRVPASIGLAALGALAFWRPWSPPLPPENSAPAASAPAAQPSRDLASAAAVNAAKAESKSLAVLPFANLSTDKENEFFADGMHDELLTALAKIGALKVISRTSVLIYREPAKRGLTLRQIAAELGVAHVLEGSVSRAGGSVRINVKLIDAATDQQRWADTYNLKAVTDVFQAQADISAQIAQTLAATISPELKLALAQKLTGNSAAYDLYLRARRWRGSGRRDLTDVAKWEELVVAPLERAVALDPKFAAAYAELSQVHSHLYWWSYLDPTPTRLAKAKAAVDQALLLDPTLPVGHSALGYYHYVGALDYARATEEFAIALAAMPGDADVLLNLAATQRRSGRWAEATANLERAFALNPRDTSISSTWIGTLLWQRLYTRAERAAERALAIDPANGRLLYLKAQARFARDGDRGRFQSALEALARTPGADPTDPRISQFRVAIEDGRYAEAVRLFEAPTELKARDSRVADLMLRRYLSAATAIGEREKVRVRALAAIAGTKSEATGRRDEWESVARLGLYHAFAGQPDEARRLGERALEMMPLKRDAMQGQQALGEVAQLHLALGDHDRALALLDQALSLPSILFAHELVLEPWWAPLRDDPRFRAALAKAAPRD